jgi:hypothetical protein
VRKSGMNDIFVSETVLCRVDSLLGMCVELVERRTEAEASR